ncbi:hypothetical protein DINM_005086 [Dirofilaria immitis]|nr:hypothetical protein [Dirofilaria immitis]
MLVFLSNIFSHQVVQIFGEFRENGSFEFIELPSKVACNNRVHHCFVEFYRLAYSNWFNGQCDDSFICIHESSYSFSNGCQATLHGGDRCCCSNELCNFDIILKERLYFAKYLPQQQILESENVLLESHCGKKLINKREVMFSIDAKYQNQIIVHCNDVDSYYLPALNECYRIYQTPHNNLDPSYTGNRNKLAYGTSQFDYMYNCWELYHGKLLDIGEVAIKEKMQLVKKIALQFYHTTGQQDAIRVGFMISRNYEMMSQNGTFYDILDGVYVRMHPSEPCDNVCCVVIKLVGTDEVEMEQASCDHIFIPNFFAKKRKCSRTF